MYFKEYMFEVLGEKSTRKKLTVLLFQKEA